MSQLSEFLKAVGPNASIVFAAWIFMGFLQQRYDGALDRYRAAVGDYRSNQHQEGRNDNLREQVLAYRYRCRLMGWATFLGLLAAILLISSLIFGGLDVIVPHSSFITICGMGSTLAGFALVVAAAFFVILEGGIVNRQLDDELRDVPDLAEQAGGGVATDR